MKTHISSVGENPRLMLVIARRCFLLTALLLLLSLPRSVHAEEAVRVIVSVEKIENPDAKKEGSVTVLLRLHFPKEIAGTSFLIVTKSRDRASVRSSLPLASLQRASLPHSLFEELLKQRKSIDRWETTVDGGIDPEMISEVVALPMLSIAELASSLSAFGRALIRLCKG